MTNKCCNFDVEEIKDGYTITIKGDNVKDLVKSCLENCCSSDTESKRCC